MDERGGEQCHPDRDVDGMPERHQPARLFESLLGKRPFDLEPVQGARDAGKDIAADKAADHDNDREQGCHAGKAVEFPGGMQQHHERTHQAHEDMDLQPGGHSSPLHAAAAFAQAVERLGHQHEQKSNDSDPMAK